MNKSLLKRLILSFVITTTLLVPGYFLFNERNVAPTITEESSNLSVGAAAGLRVYPFTYTGNATDNRDLTGFPFAPTFAWIKPADTTANGGAMSWVAMGTDKSFDPSGAATPGGDMIQAWNSDGIEIGASANVNTSGVGYYGVAFAGPSSSYKEGSYVGNGTTSNPVTGVGFLPDVLFVRRDGGSAGRFYIRQSDQASTWAAANGSSGFFTMDADGFTVTSGSSQVNTNLSTYYYVALKLETGYSTMGQFTGNATDNRAITGIGNQPDVVIIKANSGAQAPIFRTSAHSGDDTSIWISSTANTTDRIQSLDSDGFTVGTNDQANRNTATMTYLTFRDNAGTSDSQGNFLLLFDNF